MTLWMVTTGLLAIVSVLLAIPLLRRLNVPATDSDRVLAVSRAQLAEIEADTARGAMSEADAAEARREVERRVLAVARNGDRSLTGGTETGRLLSLALVLGWVVVGATGLYAVVGAPEVPGTPRIAAAQPAAPAMSAAAATDPQPDPAIGSVEESINTLLARLENDPQDAEGWKLLGWSYFNTGRYGDAADAYARAVALDDRDALVWSAYGEVLVRNAGGLVAPEALDAFDAALAIDPQDPRARFFKGMALEQAGDPQAAIEAWLEIIDGAAPDADWLPGLIQRTAELAAAVDYDVAGRLPEGSALLPPAPAPAAPGPTAEQVAAAQDMDPNDRQAMIAGMVEGLAARLADDPDDPEGWVRLIRSRMVMGDAEAAAADYATAMAALAGAPDKLATITAGARAAGLAVE